MNCLRKLGRSSPHQWEWGRVHHTAPTHPLSEVFPDAASLLDPPSVPLGGDGDTPQAASYSPAQPYAISSTSVLRYVYDLSDWGNSRWIVPLGSSGHPGSAHYADQAQTWSEVEYAPMLYGWSRDSGVGGIGADVEDGVGGWTPAFAGARGRDGVSWSHI